MAPSDLTCMQFIELVTEYFDGALNPGARLAFEAHMAECPHCATYVEQMRRTITLVGKLSETAPDPASMALLLECFDEWTSTGRT